MQVEFCEQTQQIIQQQMSTGDFASPDEVVKQALVLFAEARRSVVACIDPVTGDELDEAGLEALIREGLDDEAAGRVGTLDLDDTKRRGRERLEARQPTGS